MNFAVARAHMVVEQLEARGICDARVLEAMRVIPRHRFVDAAVQARAYDDAPLPIAAAQTISQPYMVALMTELLALHGGARVLEIGTGSGYHTAVLAHLAGAVFSIERIDALTRAAQARLEYLGYGDRVRLRVGDGSDGWAAAAPFEAIVVAAAVQEIPRPLLQQLDNGGRLVLPLGTADLQGLACIHKTAGGLRLEYRGECRFVKLVSAYGWQD